MRLIAEQLSGERGGHPVFERVSFAVGEGECLAVTGPNGAGKSTLLRIVAGLLPAAGGRVVLDGAPDDDETVGSLCHYLGHANAMKAALSVEENLAFWRRYLGEPALPVADALRRVALDGIGDLPFGYLSTGQKRRAAIARLLVSRRPIWLLDEPTAGLDAASERVLADILAKHLGGGGLVLAATHQKLGLDGVSTLSLGSSPAGEGAA